MRTVLLLGFASWFVPFAAAFVLFPLKGPQTPLFDNLMAAVLTGTAVALGLRVLRLRQACSPGAAAAIGLAWWGINIVLDLLMFSWGPMKMSPAAYLKDIGLAYSAYPIILAGLAAASRLPGTPCGAVE